MKNKLTTAIFFNHCFDKRRFQNFLYWFFKKSYFGQLRSQPPKRKLLKFLERLKFLGFHSATQAGFSISIDDLKIPSSKSEILLTAENIVLEADLQLISGNLTIIERYQRIIEIWNRTSEELKYQVLQSFKISDFLNPVYLMAFSGARGNISQIRQLVGMRGLMADPQGQIIDFPIRSNFREGLTLTEYLISCSGARKGIVDTALRTAASGYLTRRLVDVAHHVVVHQMDCQRPPSGAPSGAQGIWIEDLYDQQKKILPLQQRLIGRVLAETIDGSEVPSAWVQPSAGPRTRTPHSSSETTNFAQAIVRSDKPSAQKDNSLIIGQKNHEISKMTSQKICQYRKRVFIRSPLTCQSSKFICQLCYGWNLSEGQFVSVGEAVGVLAAQSIGEPGTQLTMRTFHTGGVFTGILMDQTYAPFSGMAHYHFPCNGLLIRTLQGKIAYLSKNNGILSIYQGQKTAPSRRFQNQKALAFGFILKNRPVSSLLVVRSADPKVQKAETKSFPNKNGLKYKLQQKRSRGSSPLSMGPAEGGTRGSKRADRVRTSNYQTLLYQLRKLKGQFKELVRFADPRKAPKERVKVRQKEMSARKLGVRFANQLAAFGFAEGPNRKLQKQIQFIFQNFTILYVRQNEKVLKKQLIAELPFFENEKSLENEQEIFSNESGEIYFWDMVFFEKTISDFKNEIQFKKNFVQNLGGFWILLGRSFQHILMGRSPFFKKFDLIDQNVPFSQIQIESNYFLNNEIDDLAKAQFLQFEQIFLSSFLKKKKINHKDRIFKQPMAMKAKNDFGFPLPGASRSNSDEYTFILKRPLGGFKIGLIFFKKWGYLRMTGVQGRDPDPRGNTGPAFGGIFRPGQIEWKLPKATFGEAPVPNLYWRPLRGPKFNFIKKIQIFNGIEPIWTYFWNKKKVFWNDRPNFQSQELETWMIGLQGQSKYITGGPSRSLGPNKYSAAFGQVVKISIKHFHIHFLKQKEFCFKFKGRARIPYIESPRSGLGSPLRADPIFLAKVQFQKQKRNFFFSDTGLILKKSKKFFCEFQNPHFLKKYKPYFVHLNDDQVQNQRSIGRSPRLGPAPLTFLPGPIRGPVLNVNPENTCILLVNRQGIFQSFERKVLKNRMASFVTSPIQVRRGHRFAMPKNLKGKLLAFFPSCWTAQVQDFLPIQDEASFRIGTQIFNKNKTKPIYKIQKSFCQWPLGKNSRFKIRQWLAQAGLLFGQVQKDSFFQPQLFRKKDNNVVRPEGGGQKERLYYWSLCTPLLPKNPFGYLDPKFDFWPRPKIQSIFCHLFLKQSRLFQNLPKNWVRQITNIPPKIIHWKNLPNQKYIFLLNFITHFDSEKYIKQKNLKKITGASSEDQRDFGVRRSLADWDLLWVQPKAGLSPKEMDGTRSPSALGPLGRQLHPKSILGVRPILQNQIYPSQVFRQHSKMDDFLEKIQRPKKRTFQPNLVGNNLQWILGLRPVEAFWRQKSHGSEERPGFPTKNLLNIGFVPKLWSAERRTKSMTVRRKPSFRIKPYNFWKIQQRQEILRYPKFKMGFYSFIRIFFSLGFFPFEDLKWMNIVYHHWNWGSKVPRATWNPPLGGQNTIYKNNWAFAFASPRVRFADPSLQFNLTKAFKTLNIRRIGQKSSYICSGFRQRMPQIFSIDEQKRIFINWTLANKKSGFILFFIQKLSAPKAPFFIQKHTKISSLIPYKTVLNIQKSRLNWKNHKRDVGWVLPGLAFGLAQDVSLPQDPEEDMSAPTPLAPAPMAEGFHITGQRSIKFNKKRLSAASPPTTKIPLKPFPFINFLNDHQQIFYRKFKKNFQNIHLNSIWRPSASPKAQVLTNLLELCPAEGWTQLEDPCIQWKFFGDGTKIFDKNIYSTYFKNFSLIENNFNKTGLLARFAEREALKDLPARLALRPRGPRDYWQKLKPLKLSKKKVQNLLASASRTQVGITYPSIHKVLVRSPDPRGPNFIQEFYRSHMELRSKLDKSSPAEGWTRVLNTKYLFDQILPRSLVRSESGILKISKYNKLGFRQLQKWILDNYFDSYLLIIKNFFLLKNFENRFFQSRPKKPIYNQFYYHDNRIEDLELSQGGSQKSISESTQQVAVKKYKLQEDIIRQYSISSLRHHSQVKRISSRFSNSAKAQFMVKWNNSDFLKNSNTMPNKEAPEFAIGPSQPSVASKNELNVASPAAKPNLQDLFELPIHLYNFYIEYISKKSSRFQSGFSSLDFEKMDMKTWFNRLKNLQKYSRRYLKSPILSGPRIWGFPYGKTGSELEDRARGRICPNFIQKGLATSVRIPSLRYKKYWRKTIFFLQKLEDDINKKKQYCFVLKWLKPLDHFYSIHFHHDFFSWQNRKSFRIPFFGCGEVWAFAGDFSQNVSLRPRRGLGRALGPIVQKPRFFQQNINIFRTVLYFKTYPIFQTLLSIYFLVRPGLGADQALRRGDWTVVPNPVHSYPSETCLLGEAPVRRSRFHNLFNFMSLQTKYLRPAEGWTQVQNRSNWGFALPLLDKKLEIFLVSVVPILAQNRSLRSHFLNHLYSRPSDRKNQIKMIPARVPGGRLDRWRLHRQSPSSSQIGGPAEGGTPSVLASAGKAQWAQRSSLRDAKFVGHTFGVLYNQTHSLKIHIIKTKHLNFLTQKCLRVETVKASEYLDQNRGFHLTNLLNLSTAKAAQQFRSLPFGQNRRNHPKLELQFQIIKRFSKRSGTPSPLAKPNLLHSSEIQIFIRFFLPFYSGEMLGSAQRTARHQQGSLSILFANASDFFSYRQNHPIDFVRSDVPNDDSSVRLGQKFKYLLFEKMQKGNGAKAKLPTGSRLRRDHPEGGQIFLLKNPSTILDRLQRHNKNKGSDVLSVYMGRPRGSARISSFLLGLGRSMSSRRLDPSGPSCLRQLSSVNKYKSDLDGLNKFDFQLQRQQKNPITRSNKLVHVTFGRPFDPSAGANSKGLIEPKAWSIFGGHPGHRVDRWQGLIAPQQLCLSQKIVDSYKLFPNFNSKIPAIMFFLKRKNIKMAGSHIFNLFKKSQKTPVVIGHRRNSLESPIQLGSFIRGLAANGRELSENLLGPGPRSSRRLDPSGRDLGPPVHLQGGQFIAKTPHIFLFRKATTHLLNDQSILHVRHGDIILKNQPLCSVFYNQSKTGDIVQGIPKIEEIFEARKKSKYSLHELPIFSKDFLFFEKIIIKYLRSLQKSVVNNIQRIYCGQGIHISDKHIEIIVRQMTSNVFIREPGQTGLLYGEIVALQWISRINVISNQVIYEPVLMGMTKTCLETSSFLSAASFQETTRILGRAALQNQIDFIRGLKQNVILGNLIPIGTGCF